MSLPLWQDPRKIYSFHLLKKVTCFKKLSFRVLFDRLFNRENKNNIDIYYGELLHLGESYNIDVLCNFWNQGHKYNLSFTMIKESKCTPWTDRAKHHKYHTTCRSIWQWGITSPCSTLSWAAYETTTLPFRFLPAAGTLPCLIQRAMLGTKWDNIF